MKKFLFCFTALILMVTLFSIPVSAGWESDIDKEGTQMVGDLDENGIVDNRDVECLLWHTLFPEDYSLSASGEMDGIPGIDNRDVEYLLWHTLFPEYYPIPGAGQSQDKHSGLYIPGVSVDDVITYYNEVVLDAEFSSGSGNASLVQKWPSPIYYMINGNPTFKDRQVLSDYVQWLNSIPGFPGMLETKVDAQANLRIHFCSYSQMINILGDNFYGCDGGVTFWYNGRNEIYQETICIRTDINQTVRNSVILEEIYNGLGPVQDTWLRTDSIIYAGYSEPQSLTAVDELLLKLLYNPQIQCGMNAAQCESVIRKLYF